MKMKWPAMLIGFVPILMVVSLGCVGEKTPAETAEPDAVRPAIPATQPLDMPDSGEKTRIEFPMTSTGFKEGEDIPIKYTCDGADLSPALSWGEPPAGTESLVLIVDDPDAPGGTFTHWVLFNLPASLRALPEGVPRLKRPGTGGIQGENDFGNIGYNGPCPPPGKPHTYRFKLYALDVKLDLPPGAGKGEVLKAMEGHVLIKAELGGRYGR